MGMVSTIGKGKAGDLVLIDDVDESGGVDGFSSGSVLPQIKRLNNQSGIVFGASVYGLKTSH